MKLSLQEKRRKYYNENKEKIKEKSSKYYVENREKVLNRNKKNYQENPKLKTEASKKYKQNNPEKAEKYQKTWKERHPEKRKLYTRNSRIRAYGISPETYYEMLKNQGESCAICKAKSTRRAMNIDHNHKTGKVRGLLCDSCNLSLGHIERKDFVEKALKYLNQYK